MSWLADLFTKRSLDDRLLTGELSPDSGQGKVRAEQLLRARHRARSAKTLRELVEEAQRPQASFFNANLRVSRAAFRLDLPAPVRRSLALLLADRLVTDGESPAYNTGSLIEDHGSLAREVERARAALKAD